MNHSPRPRFLIFFTTTFLPPRSSESHSLGSKTESPPQDSLDLPIMLLSANHQDHPNLNTPHREPENWLLPVPQGFSTRLRFHRIPRQALNESFLSGSQTSETYPLEPETPRSGEPFRPPSAPRRCCPARFRPARFRAADPRSQHPYRFLKTTVDLSLWCPWRQSRPNDTTRGNTRPGEDANSPRLLRAVPQPLLASAQKLLKPRVVLLRLRVVRETT